MNGSNILESDFTELCNVEFPAFTGKRIYMHSTKSFDPTMPEGFEFFGPMTDKILRALGITTVSNGGDVHITMDERVVSAGDSHRAPGPHVDGRFELLPQHPRGGAWGHEPRPGGWIHSSMKFMVHDGQRYVDLKTGFTWSPHGDRMAVVVAASEPGCRAWRGTFLGRPTDGGDLSHISEQLRFAPCEVLKPNVAYLLSPDCVHESMKLTAMTWRTFYRIALPLNFNWRGMFNQRRAVA